MSNDAYRVRIEGEGSNTRYFSSFVDAADAVHEIEISFEIYLALENCRRHEKRQENFIDRHVEQAELSEGQLQERMARLPPALELLVENQEQAIKLHTAIASLPESQRRRFLLYHEDGLTQEQIAALDGCSQTAIANSIQRAKEKIKEEIKNFRE